MSPGRAEGWNYNPEQSSTHLTMPAEDGTSYLRPKGFLRRLPPACDHLPIKWTGTALALLSATIITAL